MSILLALVPLVLLAQLTSAAGGDWDGVFFLGDSDIEYWDTDQAFPGSQNEGVGGWTCKKVLKEFDTLLDNVTAPWAVLVCGENDLPSRSPEATFVYFKQIVEALVARNMRVLYMGTKPEPDTRKLHDEYRSYDGSVRSYASQLAEASPDAPPPLVMVDVYQGFEAIGNPRSLYARDGLHLKDGYSHWNTWAKQALGESGCVEYRSGQCVTRPGNTNIQMAMGTNECSNGSRPLTRSECQAMDDWVAVRGRRRLGAGGSVNFEPKGCYFFDPSNANMPSSWAPTGTYWNEHSVGGESTYAAPWCMQVPIEQPTKESEGGQSSGGAWDAAETDSNSKGVKCRDFNYQEDACNARSAEHPYCRWDSTYEYCLSRTNNLSEQDMEALKRGTLFGQEEADTDTLVLGEYDYDDENPTDPPTQAPNQPTEEPTYAPTEAPNQPTEEPTVSPTEEPTEEPTDPPSNTLFGQEEADSDTLVLDYAADDSCDMTCTCIFVGTGTNVNQQYLCQGGDVCYNQIRGWCGADENICEAP